MQDAGEQLMETKQETQDPGVEDELLDSHYIGSLLTIYYCSSIIKALPIATAALRYVSW